MGEHTEKEKADSVAAFAHYLDTGSFADIEFFYEPNKQWQQKTRPIFSESGKYRIRPKPTSEDYLAGHDASGLKVGDRVKVLRKADDYEAGWKASWVDECMDEMIGEIHTIKADDYWAGFLLESTDKPGWRFPYFVLEKVGPEYRPFKNAEEFFESGIEWIRKKEGVTWHRVTEVNDAQIETVEEFVTFEELLSKGAAKCGHSCGVEITDDPAP
jgi:hypothetical protein